MKRPLLAVLLIIVCLTTAAQRPFRLIATTDVHGNYLPRDFTSHRPGSGSLARIYKYVQQQREKYGEDRVLLLDAGDLLQGQPAAYYYNFIDTTSTHLCAKAMNFMAYDAATMGNHDVETGHTVYDRWTRQCAFPILAANVTRSDTDEPYWKPYAIIRKGGVRFAVFGLLTPAVPQWLPEDLWSGLRFGDMVEAARRYMPEMRQAADVIVGLFHSGTGDAEAEGELLENATLQVARLVPGFDIVFCGHDHRRINTFVVNTAGDTVRILNAGPDAQYVAAATCTLRPGGTGISVTEAGITDIRPLTPDANFLAAHATEQRAVTGFTKEVLGRNRRAFSSRDAFFGSSAFVDFIHTMQRRITGADISFAAPLTFDTTIPQGTIRTGDIFNLYKYENHLYTMRLTGQEIKDYLEYSYAGWTRTLKKGKREGRSRSRRLRENAPRQHLLNFVRPAPSVAPGERWKLLAVPSYNFDSASGLYYSVDVTKPAGQRVTIHGLPSRRPGSGLQRFELHKTYTVAVNSYRGNGGGGHLTKGAGIPQDSLRGRILRSTERDLRYYLIQEIRKQGIINARPLR
ncbi:MAG: 5'-nucleotidase C-terminal domain-containing protein, partial [Alloprevotella sp.]|nr:5'-nucleotidase C-terminal domain-containing protein [Alloprevotella sp.]